MVVFGDFVGAIIFVVFNFVCKHVTCFSKYVSYDLGALLVCFFRCERCFGLEYLVYFEVYIEWV